MGNRNVKRVEHEALTRDTQILKDANKLVDVVGQLIDRVNAIEARLDALEYRVPGVRRIT